MTFLLPKNITRWLIYLVGITLTIYILLRVSAYLHNPGATFTGSTFSYSGYDIRYECKGSGEPVVFFETGFGSDSEATWSGITSELPDTFTSCFYDRLGYGGSDDVPTNFTTIDKALLQESLIRHIAGDRPVILVAHSYGGIISRRSVSRNTLNIHSVIFLDSAHENQHGILQGKLEPIPSSVEMHAYANAIFGLSDIRNMFINFDSALSERLAYYYGSIKWAHVLSTYTNEEGFFTPLEALNYDFDDLKLVVIAHDDQAYINNKRFYEAGPQWSQMQQSIAALSDNSELIVAEGATHNVPADRPDLVIQYIMSSVNLAKQE